jgi:very-short-patch-repair endonuclease
MADKTRLPGVCTGQRLIPGKHALAKYLRRTMTKAERVFWNAVRNNKVRGLQFRRQQVIGKYIADFYCSRLRLAVELDGEIHLKRKDYDRYREEAIKRYGIGIMRFGNEEVLSDIGKVIGEIERTISG